MVAIAAASFVGTLAALLLLAYVVLRVAEEPEAIWRGWTVSGQYGSTRRIHVAAAPAHERRATGGDFDGDGVDDELEIVWMTREFLFSEGTFSMLYVRSGASRDVLLAHPLESPFSKAWWLRDSDGDGRDDVYVSDPSPRVFSFVR